MSPIDIYLPVSLISSGEERGRGCHITPSFLLTVILGPRPPYGSDCGLRVDPVREPMAVRAHTRRLCFLQEPTLHLFISHLRSLPPAL